MIVIADLAVQSRMGTRKGFANDEGVGKRLGSTVINLQQKEVLLVAARMDSVG